MSCLHFSSSICTTVHGFRLFFPPSVALMVQPLLVSFCLTDFMAAFVAYVPVVVLFLISLAIRTPAPCRCLEAVIRSRAWSFICTPSPHPICAGASPSLGLFFFAPAPFMSPDPIGLFSLLPPYFHSFISSPYATVASRCRILRLQTALSLVSPDTVISLRLPF